MTLARLPRGFMSNADLVAGLVAGEPRAAAELYDRFGSKINTKVWRLLGADTEHDDVVHQVFIHIMAGVGRLKSPDALEDWIYGVTVNTVRREIRRRRYRRVLVSMGEPPEVSGSRNAPERELFVKAFYDVLGKLKVDDRIVFALRFVEGRSLGEVAATGGYSLSTAKRRLVRAKREFLKRAAKDRILASVIEEIEDV